MDEASYKRVVIASQRALPEAILVPEGHLKVAWHEVPGTVH
jgi:hypothetical protein